jgi:hypothetical protein
MTGAARRCPSVTPPIAPLELIPHPGALVPRDRAPDTVAGWQAPADGLLTDQGCAFHRNVEISSRYAWLYQALPTCLKWAGMAAIASHHVRLALFPLRLDADRTGYVDIPQQALVQPCFDHLSCAFARLISLGAASSFEVRGVRKELSYFTSFYLYSLTRGLPAALGAHTWPRITRYDDRWRWITTSVVPLFRRFDAELRLVDASMQRIFEDARGYASMPCVLPVGSARTPDPTHTDGSRETEQ